MNFLIMTDAEVDTLYAQYAANRPLTSTDINTMSLIATEISTRLATPRLFLTGLFGGSSFPKWQALMANSVKKSTAPFSQVQAAQSSVSTATGSLVSGSLSTIQTVLILAVVIGSIVLYKEVNK